MAIEAVIRPVYGYEDFAFTWRHADQANIAAYDLCFELLTDYGETPLVTRVIGTGITLSVSVLYEATVTLTAANLSRDPTDYVYTVSKRNSGGARLLSFGPFVLSPPRVGRS